MLIVFQSEMIANLHKKKSVLGQIFVKYGLYWRWSVDCNGVGVIVRIICAMIKKVGLGTSHNRPFFVQNTLFEDFYKNNTV
jgi:hypothetical protein